MVNEKAYLWAVLMVYPKESKKVTKLVIDLAALKVVHLVGDLDDEMAVWWDVVMVAL